MERLDELMQVMTNSYNSASGILKSLSINSLKEFLDVYRQYAEAIVYDQPELLEHPYIKATIAEGQDNLFVMLIASTNLVILEQKQRIKELEEKLGDSITLNIQIQDR